MLAAPFVAIFMDKPCLLSGLERKALNKPGNLENERWKSR